MSNYISPSMLPMEAISQYMDKIYGFGKKSESAEDTKKVSGVSASLIAKAATNDNGELVTDRETVKNALKLNGVDANKYITTDGASALLADTHEVSRNVGDEVKNLRDELYQIKAELAKSGLIKGTECYNGFIDPFKAGNEKYINKEITITSTDMSNIQTNYISVEDASEFVEGEYIVIDTTDPQIVKIQDISSNRINLETSIVGPINSGTKIYKSFGLYDNGTFSFGKQKDVAVSSQEKYIVLNDDAQPILLTKKYTDNSGYAAQINIPSTTRGAVKRIGIQARVTGYPGGLKCYIIDPTNNTNNVLALSTIQQLKEDGKIIGESDLIYASQANGSFNELYMEFSNTVVLDKPNYMFLFVQVGADTNNYWELKGLRGESSMDLQTNSKLYSFADGAGFRAEDGDLYLIVVTSEVLLNTLEYTKQGLYSSKFDLSDLTQATRVRVELKVNREGKFKVIDNPNTLVPNSSRPLNTYNEDNKSYAVNLFNTDDTIAIGNQIAKVGSSRTGNTSYNLTADTYAPAGSPVYRIGYKVQVKAIKKVFDETNVSNPIKTSLTALVDLPLVAIIPGKESGKEDSSSDRLIFEGDISLKSDSNYKLESFNEIQAQVYWENKSATKIDLNNSPELAGKILDITISTDNTYNIKK